MSTTTFKTVTGHELSWDDLQLPTVEERSHKDVDAPRIQKRVAAQLEGSSKTPNAILADIYELIAPHTSPALALLRYLNISRTQAKEMFGESWETCQHVKDLCDEEMVLVVYPDNSKRWVCFEHAIPLMYAVLNGLTLTKKNRTTIPKIKSLRALTLHVLASIVEKRNNLAQKTSHISRK